MDKKNGGENRGKKEKKINNGVLGNLGESEYCINRQVLLDGAC